MTGEIEFLKVKWKNEGINGKKGQKWAKYKQKTKICRTEAISKRDAQGEIRIAKRAKISKTDANAMLNCTDATL